ncbi:NADH-quinone oxidoreductase subunit A [Paracoccaceae bacterium Fryx2]|nr:NADH-quinone oxidoreductase subunit A [Paracoccaceae bacterium Fryx2]
MFNFLSFVDPRAALLLHVTIVVGVVVAILVVAGFLRERSRDGFGVYESGAAPGKPMQGQLDAPFFMIAVFFMIFDVEAALLFAWAVAATEVGRDGLIAATVFIAVLLAALAWLWMDGALETGPRKGGADDL